LAQFLLYMLYTSRRTESTLPTLFQSQALAPGPKPQIIYSVVFQILSCSAVSLCSDVMIHSSSPYHTHWTYVDPSGRVTSLIYTW